MSCNASTYHVCHNMLANHTAATPYETLNNLWQQTNPEELKMNPLWTWEEARSDDHKKPIIPKHKDST